MAALQEITEQSFDDAIAKGLVMVDFWAPWCGPCRMVGPVLEELQEEMTGKVNIVKVNVDENPNIAIKFSITSIPTMMVFKEGELVDRTVGAGAKDFYKNILSKHI